MPLLTALEEDAFKELFNLSFGKVASTLSEMVDAEVTLSPPFYCSLPGSSVAEYIQSLFGAEIGLVGMRYQFEFPSDQIIDGNLFQIWPDHTIDGMAVLMIRDTEMGHFLDALYGEHIPEEQLFQVEEETLQLAGDVLLYTCTSSLSTLFASEIHCEKPQFFKGAPEELLSFLALSDTQDGGENLLLRVNFSLIDKEVAGSMLTWMGGSGVPRLKAELNQFVAMYMA
ncbi:MAG: hypothetical protein HQL93_03865 [Magnetococcales bacterium]|nr:hypothetical protein [Magnetococcales bacterium]